MRTIERRALNLAEFTEFIRDHCCQGICVTSVPLRIDLKLILVIVLVPLTVIGNVLAPSRMKPLAVAIGKIGVARYRCL